MSLINIVHLDDHWRISEATKDLFVSELPNLRYSCITDTRAALSLLTNSIVADEKIDLFITDFSHDWVNGYDLAASVRKLEKRLNKEPMPILENPVALTTLRRFHLTRNNVGNHYYSWSIVSGFKWSRPPDFPL